ncbi:hypothetical protein SteCoe_32745 [Stentor coeruleus]|uniref:Rab-GAP TBC domain-containing protein n=1 Tax=Stentor coeruleus TaxID=5963 RepID=A0A1R2AYI4_9CILI|nr:hypothetical protein SteCoe_32745 [Stentor coeruleus]
MIFIKNLFRKKQLEMNEEESRNFWIDATGSRKFIFEQGKEFYEKIDKTNHKCEMLIDLDMRRIVYRESAEFQQRVKKILIGYLNYAHCEDYQSPFLVILRVVLLKIEDEFMTFVIFFQIMEHYHWRYMILEEVNIRALIKDLDFRIAQSFPKLHEYLEENNIETLCFAYTHFITIFTLNSDFAISCKILEGFFLHGHEFLIKLCYYVIKKHKKYILKLAFDEAIMFLYRSMWDDIDEDFVMNLLS